MFMLSLCTSFNLVEPRNFRQSIFPNIAQLCIAQGSTLATSGDSILWAHAILYPSQYNETIADFLLVTFRPKEPESHACFLNVGLLTAPVSCMPRASFTQTTARQTAISDDCPRKRAWIRALARPPLSSLAFSSLKNEGWRGARGFGLWFLCNERDFLLNSFLISLKTRTVHQVACLPSLDQQASHAGDWSGYQHRPILHSCTTPVLWELVEILGLKEAQKNAKVVKRTIPGFFMKETMTSS